MTSKEKGNQLELALEFLQKAIMHKRYSSKTAKFTIQQGKHIKGPGGNGEEIDLYVEVEYSERERYIVIFECKNWDKKKMTKDLPTIVDNKVKICNAQNGFIVGKKADRGFFSKVR
jgi:hypothetical protein